MPNGLLLMIGLIVLPSVVGTVYLWGIYAEMRSHVWLLKMLSITSTIVTVVLFYISWAAFNRLLGGEPASPYFSVIAIVGLAVIVPYKATRIFIAMHGGEPPAVGGNGTMEDGSSAMEENGAR